MNTVAAETARSVLTVLAVVALLTVSGCREGKKASPTAGATAVTETQPSSQPPPQETAAPPAPEAGNVLATVQVGETPPVAACPAGSSPDRPGPADQARPSGRGFETAVAFDRQSGRIVALDWTRAGPVRTWTFDVCTNTWQAMAPEREPELFGRPLVRLVYDADSDLTILFSIDYPTQPWTYSLETNTWTEQPIAASAPTDRTIRAGDAVYDPVSGLVVIRDELSAKLWAYDVETNTWTEVSQDWDWQGHGTLSLLAYDASVDRLALVLRTETWLFDPRTGTWAQQKSALPAMTFFWGDLESGGEIAFDEASSRAVVFSDGVLAAYDAAADEWEVLQGEPQAADPGTGPLNRFGHAIVYDPVNERIVLYGGRARMPEGWRRLRDLWALDLRTGGWTELVPSGRPATETSGDVLATVRAGESPPVAVCPAGSTPDRPGPADQARPGGLTAMAFDRQSGRMVVVQTRPPVRTWTFDVCTNTFESMTPEREPHYGGRPLARLVYDADSDLTILFPVDEPTRPWAYSVETNAWTEKPRDPSAPADVDLFDGDLVYDPASGLVVIRDQRTAKLWAYDVETNTWTEVDQGDVRPPGGHRHTLLAYDGSADELVLWEDDQSSPWGMRTHTWTFAPRTGTWAEQQAATPQLNTGYFESGGEIAFDQATGRTVVFSDGVLAAYDAAAGEWEVLQGDPEAPCCDTGPLNRLYHALVYDPVNERIVLYGGRARLPGGFRNPQDVWAFDPRTGEWSELLPRS